MNARILIVAGIMAMLLGGVVILSVSDAPAAAPHIATTHESPPSPTLINRLPAIVRGIGVVGIVLGTVMLGAGIRLRLAARHRSRTGVS